MGRQALQSSRSCNATAMSPMKKTRVPFVAAVYWQEHPCGGAPIGSTGSDSLLFRKSAKFSK